MPFALLRDDLALGLSGGWSYARVAGLLGFPKTKNLEIRGRHCSSASRFKNRGDRKVYIFAEEHPSFRSAFRRIKQRSPLETLKSTKRDGSTYTAAHQPWIFQSRETPLKTVMEDLTTIVAPSRGIMWQLRNNRKLVGASRSSFPSLSSIDFPATTDITI